MNPSIIIIIAVFVVFVVLALLKQRSFKGKMEGVKLYGAESLAIAQTIVPAGANITFISCGTNKDTEAKAQAGASHRASITGSTTEAFRYFGYSIVVKTEDKIYFIPVKIKGTSTLTLEQNPKLRVTEYDLASVETEVLKRTKSNYMPAIDVKFTPPHDAPHRVIFTDSFDEFQGL